MAIKRCPYCRAIIDEKDQYCNNCGTQLLFPEDESVEEEIPGEKILDEPEEEKDYDIPEPGEETRDFDSENDEDEEEDVGEEVIVVDEKDEKEEIKAKEEKIDAEEVRPAPAEKMKEEPPADELIQAEASHAAEETEEPVISPQENSQSALSSSAERNDEVERKDTREAPEVSSSATFDTRELDKIGRTAELGKAQIEEFLERVKAKEEIKKPLQAAAREATEKLPPWAREMKSQAKEEIEKPEEEEIIEEESSTTVSDSGIGLPEKITQASLPFETTARREREEIAVSEEKPVSAPMAEPIRESLQKEPEEKAVHPFKLSVFLKAKAFDMLFVAVFWLISLWMGARSMGVTLFQMFGKAPGPLFAFYGILLVFYFFLFYFFLAETLGDRLFREAEEI